MHVILAASKAQTSSKTAVDGNMKAVITYCPPEWVT